MHPIGGREIAFSAVCQCFDKVARLGADATIRISDQFIQIVGDAAYEIAVEHGEMKLGGQPVAIEHRVTNVYRREAGTWKIVHHQTDTSPAMLDVLAKL